MLSPPQSTSSPRSIASWRLFLISAFCASHACSQSASGRSAGGSTGAGSGFAAVAARSAEVSTPSRSYPCKIVRKYAAGLRGLRSPVLCTASKNTSRCIPALLSLVSSKQKFLSNLQSISSSSSVTSALAALFCSAVLCCTVLSSTVLFSALLYCPLLCVLSG